MTEHHDEQYWFNTRTGRVERGNQSIASELLGPFATEAEAARATDKLQENARRWAEEDAENEDS